ncbi:hypothetical protein [Nocardiopsis sp. YSL2]|uniref:hypothetical protein n=1 Tax=Nocardiopsis sp. YSL2 TaxID=2939492 RepID=UPI0026F478D6|nr:hypothetical protein [Nocardiopsis sp. YSL2]
MNDLETRILGIVAREPGTHQANAVARELGVENDDRFKDAVEALNQEHDALSHVHYVGADQLPKPVVGTITGPTVPGRELALALDLI